MFDQKELNEPVSNFILSKKSSKALTSRLKDKNNNKDLDTKDIYTNVTFHWNKDTRFTPLLSQTLDLVYCSDIKEVFLMLGVGMTLPHGGFS